MAYQKLLTSLAVTTSALALSGFILIEQVAGVSGQMTAAQQNTADQANHLWRHRLLLVKLAHKEQLQPLIDSLKSIEQQQALSERKLIIYADIDNKYYQLLSQGQLIEMSSLSTEVQTKLASEQGIRLVGLDGSVKAYYSASEFNLQEVIALIDTMPMRQAEIIAQSGQ